MNTGWENIPHRQFAQLRQLIVAVCSEQGATNEDRAALTDLLRSDAACRAYYVDHLVMHAMLELEHTPVEVMSDPAGEGASDVSLFPTAAWRPVRWILPVAATLLLAAALIGLYNFRDDPAPVQPPMAQRVTKVPPVAILTDNTDSRWGQASSVDAMTALGAALEPGVIEIQSGQSQVLFNSGAVVTLFGPARFEMVDADRAKLSRGRLLAYVPQRARGFSIATEYATVVDLGTEFVMAAEADGRAIVHVLKGSVELNLKNTPQYGRRLAAGQGVRIVDGVVEVEPALPPELLAVVKSTARTINLADVVAGGDGSGQGVDRGIDPRTAASTDRWFIGTAPAGKTPQPYVGDARYHAVGWSDLIDGVFVPGPNAGSTTISTTGLTTDALNVGFDAWWSPIWAWGPGSQANPRDATYWFARSPNTTPSIIMHANVGISFDLDAIRAAGGMTGPLRFTGHWLNTRLNVRTPAHVAVYVLVDGQVRFTEPALAQGKRTEAFDIPIHPNDQFLTLVVTDGGDDWKYDTVLLVNPRLQPLYNGDAAGMNTTVTVPVEKIP